MADSEVTDNGRYWHWTSVWPILKLAAILYVVMVAVEFLRSRFTGWYKQYKYLRSLPSLKYSPAFGNMHQMPSDGERQIDLFRSIMEKVHPKFCVFWMTPITPNFIIYHPDFMRAITTSSVALKPRGFGKGYEFGTPWIGEGLITANEKTWSRSRKLLNPAFHSNILKNYIRVFNECTDKLIEKLDELAETGESFDIFPLITNYTLEVTMKCILGYHEADVIGYEDGNHPYAKAVCELTDSWIKRFWNPLIWPDLIFRATARGKSFYKQCDFVHKIADDIIESRRKTMETDDSATPQGKHLDFIDILLSARDEEGLPMTTLEIRHQVDSFMFAAHDTTSTALSFILYNLAKHQDYQRKVQAEVDGVLDGRDSNYVLWEDLSEFKMMTLCSKESMRLFAPVPLLGRILTKDLEVDGVTIPSDTVVLLGTIHMHRNPAVWDRPDDFVPERFLDEDIDKFAFVPFSAGPRNCIGQNFAKMEKQVLLSRIFHRYNMQLAPGYEAPVRQLSSVLKSENGIWCTLKRRGDDMAMQD